MKMLTPAESNRQNNPNHPLVRCVDGTGPYGEWTTAEDPMQKVTGPYRVFDVLNQRHVGPTFKFLVLAKLYLRVIGGGYAPTNN